MALYLLSALGDVSSFDDACAVIGDRLRSSAVLGDPADMVNVTPEGMLSDGPVSDLVLPGACWLVDATTRSEAEAVAVRVASTVKAHVEMRETV